MKNKEIQKILQKESEKIQIPSINKNEIISNIHIEEIPKQSHKMPIAIFSFFTGIILIIFGFFIINQSTIRPEYRVDEDKKTYAIQSVLLTKTAIFDSTIPLANKNTSLPYDEIATDIAYYYALALSIEQKSQMDIDIKKSDLEEYSYQMEITENDEKYLWYYNEDIKNENKSSIEGKMIYQDNEYFISGGKKEENEELKIELELYITNQTKVEIHQEYEKKEYEYEFTWLQNDDKIKEFSIEIETKSDEKEISIEEKTQDNAKELKFKMKSSSTCEYKDDSYNVEVEILQIVPFKICFEDGTTITK